MGVSGLAQGEGAEGNSKPRVAWTVLLSRSIRYVRFNLLKRRQSYQFFPTNLYIRAVDPHSFFAHPHQNPAVFINADPDPDADPEPALQYLLKITL